MTERRHPRQAPQDLSRRKFIVGSAAVAGGGLALGFNVPFAIDGAGAAAPARRGRTSGS